MKDNVLPLLVLGGQDAERWVQPVSAETLTSKTFVFYMVNIKVSLRRLQDFHKSSIHRLEGLEFQ